MLLIDQTTIRPYVLYIAKIIPLRLTKVPPSLRIQVSVSGANMALLLLLFVFFIKYGRRKKTVHKLTKTVL